MDDVEEYYLNFCYYLNVLYDRVILGSLLEDRIWFFIELEICVECGLWKKVKGLLVSYFINVLDVYFMEFVIDVSMKKVFFDVSLELVVVKKMFYIKLFDVLLEWCDDE